MISKDSRFFSSFSVKVPLNRITPGSLAIPTFQTPSNRSNQGSLSLHAKEPHAELWMVSTADEVFGGRAKDKTIRDESNCCSSRKSRLTSLSVS